MSAAAVLCPGAGGISRIGQGCMGVGGFFRRDDSRDEHTIQALRDGIAHGLTLIDTAEAYGAGHSEELVGRAVKSLRETVFITTKVSPENLGYDGVLQAAERSLRRLDTGCIDLYLAHWPNPAVPVSETMRAMSRLVSEGMVRHVGLSNYSVPEAEEARRALDGVPIAAMQAEYNLFDRSVEQDVLPYCAAHGIVFMAYSPLDVGRLSNAGLTGLAGEAGLSPAQLALSWVVRQPHVVAIPKALDPRHIADNAAVLSAAVPDQVLDRVEALFPDGRTDLDPRRIRVDRKGLESFVPGPEILAEALKAGAPLKPIRVRPVAGGADGFDFELVEGKLRYWSWLAAYPEATAIPALIRET